MRVVFLTPFEFLWTALPGNCFPGQAAGPPHTPFAPFTKVFGEEGEGRGEGKEALSPERASFPLQTSPILPKDFRLVERRHEGSPCRFMGKPERKACRMKVAAGTGK